MVDEAIPLYTRPEAETPARARIRRLSLPFEWLFASLVALTAFAALAILVFAITPGFGAIWIAPDNAWLVLGSDAPPDDAVAFNALPVVTRFVAAAAFALIVGSLIAVFYFLYALFGRYRQGDVFGQAPQQLMQRAGFALIAFAVAPGALQPLLRLVDSPDRAWLHGHSLAALVVGAALFVFARVIALGREAEREAKEFV